MRTIAVILILSLCFVFVSAQETQNKKLVPALVLDAFKAKYPDMVQVGWKSEKNKFLVNFKIETQLREAVFDENGKWLKTFWSIVPGELPKPVLESLSKTEYIKWEITETDQGETPEYPLIYQTIYKNGKRLVTVLALPDGTIVKKEEEKE